MSYPDDFHAAYSGAYSHTLLDRMEFEREYNKVTAGCVEMIEQLQEIAGNYQPHAPSADMQDERDAQLVYAQLHAAVEAAEAVRRSWK